MSPLLISASLTKPRGSPRAAGSAEQLCARYGNPTRKGSWASGTLETDTDLESALSTPDKKEDQTRLRFSWGGPRCLCRIHSLRSAMGVPWDMGCPGPPQNPHRSTVSRPSDCRSLN